jgi:YHS domain-containing protein
MKKTLLMIGGLMLLAGAPAITRAADTNSTGSSTNAPVKPYPLNYCLISGDKVGAMGKPPVLVYHGQEIKFCCGECPPEFKKDPEKYMKKLTEAVAKKQTNK